MALSQLYYILTSYTKHFEYRSKNYSIKLIYMIFFMIDMNTGMKNDKAFKQLPEQSNVPQPQSTMIRPNQCKNY